MHRKQSTIACLLTIVISLSASAPAALAQQTVSNDWRNVQSLSSNQDISVKLRNGKSTRGKFASATDSQISIVRNGRQQEIARDTVAQIYRIERKAEKGKYTAIGAAIGAGAGLAIGGANESSESDDSEIYTIFGTVLGTGIGAVGGLLFGAAKRKHVLIYQA